MPEIDAKAFELLTPSLHIASMIGEGIVIYHTNIMNCQALTQTCASFVTEEFFLQPECHVNQPNHHRHFHQRTNHRRKSRAAVDAKHRY